MAQALPVYATAAILLVASAGPVLAGVRDASLADFEDLEKPRPLSDFPFLKEVQPYLPPLIVEWVIVKKGKPFDLPPGADFYVDPDGRVMYVFPDGCQETQDSYRAGSDCLEPDCTTDANATLPECDPCVDPANADLAECAPPVPDCQPGYMAEKRADVADNATGNASSNDTTAPSSGDDGWICVPDPACQDPDGDGQVPDGCPPYIPPPPPCPLNEVQAYDGTCIPAVPHRLRSASFQGTTNPPEWTGGFELKVPYENLSLRVQFDGIPRPEWQIKVFDAVGTQVCWWSDGESGDAPCDLVVQDNGGFGSATQHYHDAEPTNVPRGNYTLWIDYNPRTASTGALLNVSLFGKPYDDSAEPDA